MTQSDGTTGDAPGRCLHRSCDGDLIACGVDRHLPGFIERYECRRCGEWYLLDVDDGSVQIDA